MRKFNKVYVGNLNLDTDEDGLYAKFSKYGHLEHISLVRDKNTGRSRGFAFITFENSEDAIFALEEMDGFSLEGSLITVNEAFERERPRTKSTQRIRFEHLEDPLEKSLFEAQKALDKAYSLYRDRKRR